MSNRHRPFHFRRRSFQIYRPSRERRSSPDRSPDTGARRFALQRDSDAPGSPGSRRWLGGLVLVLMALMALYAVSAAATPLAAVADEEFRWEGTLQPGQLLTIDSMNGGIEAEGASGDRAEVEARISGRDAEEVEIVVIENADGVSLCTVERDRRREDADSCHEARGRGSRDLDARIEFRVRVPDGVDLDAGTGNGGLRIRGVTGDVDASTGNGRVEVATAGLVRASTGNGRIRAEIGRTDWSGELEFSTGNGSIDLIFPAGLSTEVEATTGNGSIESDFPITLEGGRFSGHHLHGTIGDGGRELHASTGNGSIHIIRER